MVGEYALRNSTASISECNLSLAARWSRPTLSPYHERSPNSEAEFFASSWLKGGAGWNALRARRVILRSGSRAHRKRLRPSTYRQNINASSVSYWPRSLSMPSLVLFPSRSRLRRTRVRQKWWGERKVRIVYTKPSPERS